MNENVCKQTSRSFFSIFLRAIKFNAKSYNFYNEYARAFIIRRNKKKEKKGRNPILSDFLLMNYFRDNIRSPMEVFGIVFLSLFNESWYDNNKFDNVSS